jgi:hypothetical protein
VELQPGEDGAAFSERNYSSDSPSSEGARRLATAASDATSTLTLMRPASASAAAALGLFEHSPAFYAEMTAQGSPGSKAGPTKSLTSLVSGDPSVLMTGPLQKLINFASGSYALMVTLIVAAAIPLSVVVIPRSSKLFLRCRRSDAYAEARPLDDGETVTHLSSALGTAMTIAYWLGSVAAVIVVVFSWMGSNTLYSSSLVPVDSTFAWQATAQPMNAALVFAADATAQCSEVAWLSGLGAASVVGGAVDIRVYPVAVASTAAAVTSANATSASLPTVCLVTFDVRYLQSKEGVSSLLSLQLRLPASAQAYLFRSDGKLTPAGGMVGADRSLSLNDSAVPDGTLPIAAVGATVTVTSVLEDNDVTKVSSTGLMVSELVLAPTFADSSLYSASRSFVAFTLSVEPAQQYMVVTVVQRLTVVTLIASIIGLVGGLRGGFRILFKVFFILRKKCRKGYLEKDLIKQRVAIVRSAERLKKDLTQARMVVRGMSRRKLNIGAPLRSRSDDEQEESSDDEIDFNRVALGLGNPAAAAALLAVKRKERETSEATREAARAQQTLEPKVDDAATDGPVPRATPRHGKVRGFLKRLSKVG